jgi:hypothetical protein
MTQHGGPPGWLRLLITVMPLWAIFSVQVEVGEGVRSLGVGVELRPGYCHASTQTDPVQTRDMAV